MLTAEQDDRLTRVGRGTPPDMKIMHEETFGPVAALTPFDDELAVMCAWPWSQINRERSLERWCSRKTTNSRLYA